MQGTAKLLLCVVCALALAPAGFAQARRRSAGIRSDLKSIEIEDIAFTIKDIKLQSIPYDDQFDDLPDIKRGGRLEWLMILVEYEWELSAKGKRKHKYTQGDRRHWLNQLEFNWRVVLAQPSEGGTVKGSDRGQFNILAKYAVRLEKKVTYANIDDDGEHQAVLLINAPTLKRFIKSPKKSSVFCDLRIKLNGRELAHMNSHGEKQYAAVTKGAAAGEGKEGKRRRYIPRSSTRGASYFESDKVKELKSGLHTRLESPWLWTQLAAFETIVEATKD